LKAAVKRNAGSAATSDKPQSKMAKVCHCETPEANRSGVSSEVQQEPLAEPPVILHDLHVSEPSEAQNIIISTLAPKEHKHCVKGSSF